MVYLASISPDIYFKLCMLVLAGITKNEIGKAKDL